MSPLRNCPLQVPRTSSISALVLMVAGCTLNPSASAADVVVQRRVIDADFPGAYQVEIADVDGDRRPDIIAVGGGTCAWYQNPTWKKRIVTGEKQTPGIISSATIDLLGDGRADIAIAYEFAMSEPTKGKLLLASQDARKGLDEPWNLAPIAEIGSIHRLRWGDFNGDRRPDLAVAPIFGARARPPQFDQDGATLTIYFPKVEGNAVSWKGERPSPTFPILHAIDVIDRDRDGLSEIYTASKLGVIELLINPLGGWAMGTPLTSGSAKEPAGRGASEVHSGRLADGRPFLATIEPWHGGEVVVHMSEKPADPPFGTRTVIDATLADGHALWVADVDGDGDDEILAGHRGKDHRVSIYDRDRAASKWSRTVLDRDIAAQDMRGGDLDGDGAADVVAVGGSTHNVVWYHFSRP